MSVPVTSNRTEPTRTSTGKWDCHIREAILAVGTIGPETPCRDVFDMLTENPDFPAVAIVEGDNAVIGVITRNTCIGTLSKPLLLDLYAKRPIRQLMTGALTIDGATTLDAATDLIARQHPQALIDGFIVVDNGDRYAGVVSPQGLLSLNIEQSRRRAQQMREAQDDIIRQKRETEAAREHLGNLLDSSGQGFLSFGADLVVDPLHSAACATMLGCPPGGKDLAGLLFLDDPAAADLLRSIVGKVFAETHPVMRDILLSLLPEEVALGERVLRVEYRPLDGRQMMLVLTDNTERRRLERAVEAERKHLEMIVAAVSHSRDFFDTVEDFRRFVAPNLAKLVAQASPPKVILDEVYREIHTYKGLFNQFSFEKLSAALHQIEGRLAALRPLDERLTIDKIVDATTSLELDAVLDADLEIIADSLGPAFIEGRTTVSLSADQALRLERLATSLSEGASVDLAAAEIRTLLAELAAIRKVSLKTILASFDQAIAQVALRLGREVAPIVVLGDDVMVDPDAVRALQRSLVHVFRNAVAHGIEDADERLAAGKNEAGRITCRVASDGAAITIDIADDGRGIDVESLRRKMVSQGIYDRDQAAGLDDQHLVDMIFTDDISTAAEVSDIAGRGVGLAAVRSAVRQLGGTVGAVTSPGQGTRFVFSIPCRALTSKG
jgi:signal transduction histidine kinase/CBS domain-containing protein